mmetsp:Transcript_63652/g.146417  ORF Transcript_63652/g.146417 Transcript_63652/m.146417 type:complete len:221 (-) Transcript_63652:495-1157(-)
MTRESPKAATVPRVTTAFCLTSGDPSLSLSSTTATASRFPRGASSAMASSAVMRMGQCPCASRRRSAASTPRSPCSATSRRPCEAMGRSTSTRPVTISERAWTTRCSPTGLTRRRTATAAETSSASSRVRQARDAVIVASWPRGAAASSPRSAARRRGTSSHRAPKASASAASQLFSTCPALVIVSQRVTKWAVLSSVLNARARTFTIWGWPLRTKAARQ